MRNGFRKTQSVDSVVLSGKVIDGQKDLPARLRAEIAKRQETEEMLHESRKLLQMVSNLSANFIYLTSDEVDGSISDVMSMIGRYAGAERGCIFQFNEERTGMDMSHEWYANETLPRGLVTSVGLEGQLTWFVDKMRNLEIVRLSMLSELPPEAQAEKKQFRKEEVKSLITVPIVHGFDIFGFVRLDTITKSMVWPEDLILLLRMVGEWLAGALVQKESDELLRASILKYKSLFENAFDGILLMKNSRVVDCNPQALRLFRRTREEMIGFLPGDFSPAIQPDGSRSRKTLREKAKRALAGVPQFFEWRHLTRDGSSFDAEVNLSEVKVGEEKYLQAIIRDITSRKRSELALRESEERYRSLFGSSRDAIYITRGDGSFVDMNQSFLDLFGTTREVVLTGNAKSAYLSPEELQTFKKVIKEQGYVKDYEIRFKRNDGTIMYCLISTTTRRNDKGDIVEYQGIIRDISATKKTEETIRYMAYHDALTGLPNRVLFNDRLRMAIASAAREGTCVAVMMLDLDKFKEVNDTLGHKIGDLLLKDVSERLSIVLRKSDTIARMGGDEFLIVLPDVDEGGDASMVAKKIVDAFEEPFKIEGYSLAATTSTGIAIYPRDGREPETIVKHADVAMYYAKSHGRNKFVHYGPHMEEEYQKKGRESGIIVI